MGALAAGHPLATKAVDGEVTVTVHAVNDAPEAVADEATTGEDVAATIDAVTNDVDIDGDALNVTAVSTPTHGTATIEADGTISYVPAADFHGIDTFDYTVSDGTEASNSTVTVTVTPVNDAPIFASSPVTEAVIGQTYSHAVMVDEVDGGEL